jgi:hypothetical protein
MAAVALAATAGAHDCHCRFSGQTYDQGETVCMRGKVALCDMYLNNSSWKVVADACPMAASPRPRQLAISPVPVVR